VKKKHFQSSEKVRDFAHFAHVRWSSAPFALCCMAESAALPHLPPATAGLAEIAAGLYSHGVGGYLAGRTEIVHMMRRRKEVGEEIESLMK